MYNIKRIMEIASNPSASKFLYTGIINLLNLATLGIKRNTVTP